MLNKKAAADFLGVGIAQMNNLIRAGKLTAYYYDAQSELVARPAGNFPKQAQELFFQSADLQAYKDQHAVSVREMANRLGICTTTVYRRLRAGKMPGELRDHRWRIADTTRS